MRKERNLFEVEKLDMMKFPLRKRAKYKRYKSDNSRKNIKITIPIYLMKKMHPNIDKTQVCESQNDQIQNFPPFQKPSLGSNETEEIMKKGETKNSMERFYEAFFKDYVEKSDEIFTLKELTQNYGVKNRRVYELIGILEGFTLVFKMKKVGTYMWLGLQKKGCIFHFEQNKSVALKNIAGLIKLILSKFRQGLTIKQLNQKVIRLIQEKTKQAQCKLTINRRIYECLKVMRIFRMVEKENCNIKANRCRDRNPSQSIMNLTAQTNNSEIVEKLKNKRERKKPLIKMVAMEK